MESLVNDRVPVLRISYEQLCEKIRTQANERDVEERRDRGTTTENLGKKPTNRTRSARSKESENEGQLTANLLKQTLKSSSKSNNEKVWQWAWSQFNHYKADLDKILCSCTSSKLDQAIEQCTCLEGLCKQLYTENIDVAFKHDLVAKLWRTVHYPVTEVMRKLYKTNRDAGLIRILLSFFDHLLDYYSKLIKTLQQECGFELSVLTGDTTKSTVESSKTYHRKLKQAINVCHQCYIFMGDTARYSEELSTLPQWSRPRKYYLKSVDLVPKNGHPYNQLAVIAINSHRRLDAVYYYIRSLCSKNVFLSANDSLVTIFDETAKKALSDEMKEKCKQTKEKKKLNKNKKIQESNNREIWIMPGRKGIDTIDKKEELSLTMDDSHKDVSELSRKLVNSFLIIHGKLFSRIGIETFDQSTSNLLVLLNSYLKTDLTVAKDGERFVMMVAINIFSVYQKMAESKASDGNHFYIIHSLSFGLQFITHLITRISHDTFIKESLTLLPCVRIWLGWFFNNVSEFVTLFNHTGLESNIYEFFVGFTMLLNCWTELIPTLEAEIVKVPSCDKFWEDKLLAGFTPLVLEGDYLSYPELNSLSQELHYCQSVLRMKELMDFGNQVTLIDMVPLCFATETGRFSVTMVKSVNPPLLPTTQCGDSDGDQEETITDDDDIDLNNVTSQLHKLKLEKERLSRQMESQVQTEQATQSLLDEAELIASSMITIRPKYLVPDTNCFIINLDILKSLVDSGQFIVAIPLTVKAELDGLCKGSLLETDKDITGPAQLALDYISSKVGSSLLVKVLTSQGSLLSSLSITTELTDKATNDDLILTSCIKLHDRVNSDHYYCVVLLTDDRNLRVKSHASHMPVKNIQTFRDLYIQQNN